MKNWRQITTQIPGLVLFFCLLHGLSAMAFGSVPAADQAVISRLEKIHSLLAARFKDSDRDFPALGPDIEDAAELEKVTWVLIDFVETEPSDYSGDPLALYMEFAEILMDSAIHSGAGLERSRLDLREHLKKEARGTDMCDAGAAIDPNQNRLELRRHSSFEVARLSLRLNIVGRFGGDEDLELLRELEADPLVGPCAVSAIQRIVRRQRSKEK